MKEYLLLHLVLAVLAAVVAWFVILPIVTELMERMGL